MKSVEYSDAKCNDIHPRSKYVAIKSLIEKHECVVADEMQCSDAGVREAELQR